MHRRRRKETALAIKWSLTIDCAQPARLAEFWALALGYVPASPPSGFASWGEWMAQHGVPEEERDDGAYLVDPAGIAPGLSFLKVREAKVVKNRVHLDVQVGGGREATPWETRWPRVLEAVGRLTAAGATVLRADGDRERPDHMVMADPEGNEFDLL
jgi:Glyoxalase-like domain